MTIDELEPRDRTAVRLWDEALRIHAEDGPAAARDWYISLSPEEREDMLARAGRILTVLSDVGATLSDLYRAIGRVRE